MANKGDQKSDLRSSRMSLKHSKHDEDTLHSEFLRECRKYCDPAIKAFVECSKREGLLVVFRCREQNRAMNECLHPLSTDVKYEEWKKKLGIVSTPDGPKRVSDLQ